MEAEEAEAVKPTLVKSDPLYVPPAEQDDSRFETIMQFAQLAASLARSAEEAAWRGNRGLLEGHLKELRLTVMNMLKVFNELGK